MRITGGLYKGRNIQCPPGIIRPAMDRMRESLFAILGNLEGSSFLDLFTGSGCVGIEAASRGAEPVVLVERDFKKKFVIQRNLGFVEQDVMLYMKPVERFIRTCKQSFDIIYLDPPFNYSAKDKLIALIAEAGLLKEEGSLIIHLPREDKLPAELASFTLYDERRYGRSLLQFFSK